MLDAPVELTAQNYYIGFQDETQGTNIYYLDSGSNGCYYDVIADYNCRGNLANP